MIDTHLSGFYDIQIYKQLNPLVFLMMIPFNCYLNITNVKLGSLQWL